MTSTPEDAELLKLCEKPLHEMNSHHVLTVQTALKSRLLSPAIASQATETATRTPGTVEVCSECGKKNPGSGCTKWGCPPRVEGKIVESWQRDPGCAICAGLAPGALAPPHDANPRCESGKHPHCSCDICF